MSSANDPKHDPLAFFQNIMFARLSAELQVHRELIESLLAKETSILQGKAPKDYLESKIQERVNLILAGMADVSHAQATLAATILLPKKKDDQPPPSEG